MFRWRRYRAASGDAGIAEAIDRLADAVNHLSDVSETLERSEAIMFDMRNTLDNLAARIGVTNV